MDWKVTLSKFNFKSQSGRWLLMLAAGLICLILAWPSGNQKTQGSLAREGNGQSTAQGSGAANENSWTQNTDESYEKQLEERLKKILSQVEGVGEVEVMIVLRESEEKVWRVDASTSISNTQETDQSGGVRKIESNERSEETILSGQSGQGEPILEKEIRPQIGGVVISAQGGGNPKVQAEITEAAEALFDVPSHKIKVLKMVSGS